MHAPRSWRQFANCLVVAFCLSMVLSCNYLDMWLGRTIRLSFQVAQSPVPTASFRGARGVLAEVIIPTHAAVMGLNPANQFIEYVELDDDPVHAYLPLGEVYAIAIFGPDLDGRMVNAGPVRIGSFDLDILPIDEDGASVIDLGVLTGGVNGFVSELPDEEISDALGYSTSLLRELGAVDRQILRLLNPDANTDGLIDHEQGIEWGVFISHDFSLTPAAASLIQAPDVLRADLLELAYIGMHFWTTEEFGRYFTQEQRAEMIVDLPATVTSEYAGGDTTHLTPVFVGPEEDGSGYGPITDAGGSYGSGAFSWFDLFGDVEPDGPYVGDHVFHIGSDRYVIDDMNFYQHGNDFAGVPFPVYEMSVDSDGFATAVSWAWYWVDQEHIMPTPPEIVELMVSEFVVQFGHMPSYGGIEGLSYPRPPGWFEGSTLLGLRADDIDMRTYQLSFYTRDLYGNTLQHYCPDSYLGQDEE